MAAAMSCECLATLDSLPGKEIASALVEFPGAAEPGGAERRRRQSAVIR